MAILGNSGIGEFAGQVGVRPNYIPVNTTNTFEQVTTPGFLNDDSRGISYIPGNLVLIGTTDVGAVFMQIKIDNQGIITLRPSAIIGVTGPVTNQHLVMFNVSGGGDITAQDSEILNTDVQLIANAVQKVNTAGQTIATAISSIATPVVALLNTISTSVTGGALNTELTGLKSIATLGANTMSGGAILSGITGQINLPATVFTTGSVSAAIRAFVNVTGSLVSGGRTAAVLADFENTISIDSAFLYGFFSQILNGAIIQAHFGAFGAANYFVDLNDNGATPGTSYFLTAGTAPGSAGDTTKCNAADVMRIRLNGADRYIPIFNTNA